MKYFLYVIPIAVVIYAFLNKEVKPKKPCEVARVYVTAHGFLACENYELYVFTKDERLLVK